MGGSSTFRNREEIAWLESPFRNERAIYALSFLLPEGGGGFF
jgi:hypothetical protein